MFGSTFKNNFQNTEKKKKKVWETISIFEIFKRKLQNVISRICRLFLKLFLVDNDKERERAHRVLFFSFLMTSFKFKGCEFFLG